MNTTLNAQTVKDSAMQQGADFVGIASAEKFPESVPPRSPLSLLKGAKSVIAFGIAALSGSVESPCIRVATGHFMTMYGEVDRIAYRVGRFLERNGHRAVTVPSYMPIEMSRETRGMVGDLSFKHAAVAAGLSVWGRCRLVLTTQWGPRIRLGVVVTDAPLEADSPLKQDLCTDCRLCIEECPPGAISDDNKVDTVKCLLYSQKYGLAHFSRFLSDLFTKTDEERQKAIRDPYLWNLYQALSVGLDYTCVKCTEVCPVGQ